MTTLRLAEERHEQRALWLRPSLQDTAGRDPLGFNTITLDRILPQLLPGILQLSERARYFSIYPWMLWQFAERKLPATGATLDAFIRRREFELCLAMKLCPRCDAAKAIGSKEAGPRINSGEDPIERGCSVESDKGGFGLYYRSPLVELGAVVPVGTPLGTDGGVTPIEVLREDERAFAAARAFHDAIEETEYCRRYERTNDPIPRQVLAELGERACLCRLAELPEEREAVRDLLFAEAPGQDGYACEARRRGFALFLSLLGENAGVAAADGEFWRSLIGRFLVAPTAADLGGETVAAWAAVAMKECVQDATCSIWVDFCRTGWHAHGSDGLSGAALREMIRGLAAGGVPPLGGVDLTVLPETPAAAAREAACAAARQLDWEDVRAWAAAADSAAAGLIALLVFSEWLPDRSEAHPIWSEIAARRTEHQDGLQGVISLVRARLAGKPSFSELLEWALGRFVIGPHEAIAYSKLPRSTFRFSHDERGRLCFFSPGSGGLDRFDPSDDRRRAMTSLTRDVDFWNERDGAPRLTADGAAFVAEVLG